MLKLFSIVLGCLFAVPPESAHAQTPRFKAFTESDMNEAQLKAARDLAGGQRGRFNPYGPNAALLRSPDLMARTQRVGEYLRYNSSIPQRLNEFAILITARQWSSQTEWVGHYELAVKAGLSRAVADDLAQGKRPAGMKDDEAVVYQFCKELHETKEVSDETYKAVLDRFGERGVVDLVGVTGYYTMLAMVLNVTRQPMAPGTPALLPVLK